MVNEKNETNESSNIVQAIIAKEIASLEKQNPPAFTLLQTLIKEGYFDSLQSKNSINFLTKRLLNTIQSGEKENEN